MEGCEVHSMGGDVIWREPSSRNSLQFIVMTRFLKNELVILYQKIHLTTCRLMWPPLDFLPPLTAVAQWLSQLVFLKWRVQPTGRSHTRLWTSTLFAMIRVKVDYTSFVTQEHSRASASPFRFHIFNVNYFLSWDLSVTFSLKFWSWTW